ncbi:MAG TPA: DUF3501 family protein [Polyangia bacterium]
MRKVERSEIVDFATYSDRREATRKAVLEAKRVRRVHVGECLTFLFENTETIRYQIQEIMRAERIVRESDVQSEIDTYNQMLGGDGELGCCLLIEIDDREARNVLLRKWRNLPDHLYVRCEDGRRVAARYDEAQANEEKISSVQYLKFAVGNSTPVAVGSDHPDLTQETTFTDEQRAALLADLAS